MIHDALLTNYGDFRFTTANPRGTKNAMADWLLGLPNSMAQDAPTTRGVPYRGGRARWSPPRTLRPRVLTSPGSS
jgi:hypothetical protein